MDRVDEIRAALEHASSVSIAEEKKEKVSPLEKQQQSADPVRHASSHDKRPVETVESRGFFSSVTEPFTGIRSVLRELSPNGLAERGIPFASILRMPRSVLVASIVINMFGLALPIVILQVYDRIIPNKALETFSLMMFGLGIVVILEGLLRVARSYIVSWSATRFTKAITQELIGRFLYASDRSFSDVSQAKTIERLSNISRLAEFYGGQSRLMFIDLPFAIIFLLVMGLIGGWLVIVPFVVLCLFGFATITSSRQYKEVLEEKEEHEARTYDFVAETVKGILTMKSQSAEPLLIRRFERLQAKNAQLHFSIIAAAMQGQSIASLLGNGTMIAMVTTGAFMAVQGNMTIGVLAACSLLSGRAVQPILRVASTWNEFQRTRLSVDEVSKLFTLHGLPDVTKSQEDPPTPTVSVRDMTIDLGSAARSLANLSFEIEPGEIIAIVGPDGSGKTSFMNVIAGLLSPTTGSVMLEGVPAYDFRRQYKAAVGALDSNTEVFAGTIFENLSLFGQGASAGDVRWATGILDLERDIDKLPQGYDTPLGQGITETLPAAFIHRLQMARILAQKPVLCAFDEPQAGLDLSGQEAFLSAIDNLRGWVTFFYTTNSEKFIRGADRILYVCDGRVAVYDNIDHMNEALEQDNPNYPNGDDEDGPSVASFRM